MGEAKKPDTVVLLHGITLTSAFMAPIENSLAREGFRVVNVDYASTRHSQEVLADQVAADISDHMGAGKPRLHFVGHSMGGNIAKKLIVRHQPKNLRSLIMLGTPNQGSEWADLMKSTFLSNAFYQLVFGPAGQQLSTDRENPNDKIKAKVGVIAGSRSFLPFIGDWILGDKPHDGLVSVDRSRFPDAEHVVVPTDHMSMLVDPRVKDLILRKIRHGRFDHQVAPELA